MTAPALRRPALRYHGGKWRIAPWILSHLPPHRIYVEPFAGAASVLLRKPRSFAEVYNDLDGDVVNVFRVLRDPGSAAALTRQLELTPWSREEFHGSYEPAADSVEQARRTIARTFMAYGSSSRRPGRSGFRAKAYRRNQTGAQDWINYPAQILAFTERLRGVTIERKSALEVIAQQDSPETLFYVDPPYLPEVRSSLRGKCDTGRAYAHDLTATDHEVLGNTLHQVQGMVVISGYPSALYDRDLYAGWHRVTKRTQADGAVTRMEVLWISPRAWAAL